MLAPAAVRKPLPVCSLYRGGGVQSWSTSCLALHRLRSGLVCSGSAHVVLLGSASSFISPASGFALRTRSFREQTPPAHRDAASLCLVPWPRGLAAGDMAVPRDLRALQFSLVAPSFAGWPPSAPRPGCRHTRCPGLYRRQTAELPPEAGSALALSGAGLQLPQLGRVFSPPLLPVPCLSGYPEASVWRALWGGRCDSIVQCC